MNADPEKLAAFIESAGLSYRQNSRSYIFDCPKCRHKNKLYMEKRGGRFICFFCAETDRYKGRPEFALADLALTPLREVQEFLYGTSFSGTANSLDLCLSDLFGGDDVVENDALVVVPEVSWPWDCYPIDHEFSKRGREYLAGRGIDLAMAQGYGLRYCPPKLRVVFPVELGEKLVGWQERLVIPSRVWSEEKQKFMESAKMLSSKDVPTAHVVMFANRLVGSEHVVVCEGPVDAIKMHLAGGNIATMGKAVSRGQIQFIRNSGVRKVYLALDPDAARETARLVREFSDLEVYLVEIPAGAKDIGELSFEDAYGCFLQACRVGAGHLSFRLG